MKIELRDLILLDAIRVVLAATQEQQEHFKTMTGAEWDIDGVALGGFLVVGHGDPVRLISCLLGFLLARVAVTRLTRRWMTAPAAKLPRLRHAP